MLGNKNLTLFQELSYLSFQNQILTLQRASGFNISDLQVGKLELKDAETQRPGYHKPRWRWTVGPLCPQPAQALHLFSAPGQGKTVHGNPIAASNLAVSRSPQERKNCNTRCKNTVLRARGRCCLSLKIRGTSRGHS